MPLVRIEVLRNVNRSADGEAFDIQMVGRSRNTRAIVRPAIGVELVVAMREPSGPVKLLRSAPGDDVDRAAAAAPILGLIVGRQHAHFGDRVHVWLEMYCVVGAGI